MRNFEKKLFSRNHKCYSCNNYLRKKNRGILCSKDLVLEDN